MLGLRSRDWDVADPLETRHSPRVTMSSSVVLGQTVCANVRRSAWKKLVPRARPFKVAQGYWIRHRSIGHPVV